LYNSHNEVVSHLVVSHLTTLLCSPCIYLLFCLLATVYLGEFVISKEYEATRYSLIFSEQ